MTLIHDEVHVPFNYVRMQRIYARECESVCNIYIYVCICVCVKLVLCVCVSEPRRTHIRIRKWYNCVCVVV